MTSLACCVGFFMFNDKRFEMDDREGGEAAQTGTAAGFMIEQYHLGCDAREAMERAQLAKDQPDAREGGRHAFPRADMTLAERMFKGYADDPRNDRELVRADSLEARVKVLLKPDSRDPTGMPIHIRGHLDQVRWSPAMKRWELWDVKSGKPGGLQMLFEHCWQLCAYSLGATALFGEPVHPGGIIRVRGYKSAGPSCVLCGSSRAKLEDGPVVGGTPTLACKNKKGCVKRVAEKTDAPSVPGGMEADDEEARVFFHAPWELSQCEEILSTVAYKIGQLRAGLVPLTPGNYCQWCAAAGIQNCGRRIDEHFGQSQ